MLFSNIYTLNQLRFFSSAYDNDVAARSSCLQNNAIKIQKFCNSFLTAMSNIFNFFFYYSPPLLCCILHRQPHQLFTHQQITNSLLYFCICCLLVIDKKTENELNKRKEKKNTRKSKQLIFKRLSFS